MKFIVSSSDLLKGLQAISGVINSNSTLPILEYFLFELKENTIFITATDLETTLTVSINTTMSEEEGKVAMPAKLLLELLKTYSDTPLLFVIDDTNIDISADEAKFKISGQPVDEFPIPPIIDDTASVIVPSELLHTGINSTIFATGNDEIRPAMSGVFCNLVENSITLVATDAHKLVKYKRTDIINTENVSFILPKKPLNILKSILNDSSDEVTIEYNKTNARFKFNNIELICRLIEGVYPNYEAVIPSENPNILIVDRQLLVTIIKRATFFASKATGQIKLTISGQEILVDSEDYDFLNQSRQRLSCNFKGEDMVIGFNSKFLLEMITSLSAENIKLELSAPNRAGILRPIEDDKTNQELLMLVMPVTIN